MAAAGVRQDLLPLMRIPDMDAGKARALFKAGLRDTHVRAAVLVVCAQPPELGCRWSDEIPLR